MLILIKPGRKMYLTKAIKPTGRNTMTITHTINKYTINKYTFADGTYVEAETIEAAVMIQKSQGRSSKVVKREQGR